MYLLQIKVLDPRLKLQYMVNQEWEKEWIDEAKAEVFLIFNICYKKFIYLFKFVNLTGTGNLS